MCPDNKIKCNAPTRFPAWKAQVILFGLFDSERTISSVSLQSAG